MQFLHVGGEGSPSLYGYSVILVDVELDFPPFDPHFTEAADLANSLD